METRIGFTGSGVMAEVMIRGLLTDGLTSPDRVWAAGPRPERAEQLFRDYGVRSTTDNLEAVAARPPASGAVFRRHVGEEGGAS
jgi:pyrroline-5-carboxylate reductase